MSGQFIPLSDATLIMPTDCKFTYELCSDNDHAKHKGDFQHMVHEAKDQSVHSDRFHCFQGLNCPLKHYHWIL